MHNLTVGELAKRSGVSKVTIRYYERCGLLPKAIRTHSGYRVYPETVIKRLRFIVNSKSVGFTLEEISELLKLQTNPSESSQQVRNIAITKIDTIKDKMSALQSMLQELEHLVSLCDGKTEIQHCPILQSLHHE